MVKPATTTSWTDYIPHKQISSILIENQAQHGVTSNYSDSRALLESVLQICKAL
jgi:hypothetical protein